MQTRNMDSSFDTLSDIESLTVNNIGDVTFEEMLNHLSHLVLTEVPENWNFEQEKRRLDFLLARSANLYAYLRVLWAQVSYLRDKDKTNSVLAKKKEALYELGNAVKLKYEAVSRKITLELEEDETPAEQASYDTRRAARDVRNDDKAERAEPVRRQQTGWAGLS